MSFDQEQRPRCPNGCGEEIDPDVCHCGDPVDEHKAWTHNHSPVPMGCACHLKPSPPLAESQT